MRLTEIRIAGFGGQGVILSAAVIGKAASIFQGGFATMTQNFGPEARGGACSAQVILSDQPILFRSMLRRAAWIRWLPPIAERSPSPE
jgi:2-oxoglutarate ferredoxin oxidoreductase subunit gamma